MLKTLEEPPSFAHLILLTSRPGEVLPTIASRCQPVRFDAPSASRSPRAWSATASTPARPMRARGSASATRARALALALGDGPALRAGTEAVARGALRDEIADRPWTALLDRARAAGAQAGDGIERALDDELGFAITKDHGRLRREAAERGKRAARRAQTAALDRGLALVGLWLRDVACVADGAPELAHHSDRLAALREDAALGHGAGRLRTAHGLVEETRASLQFNPSEELALDALGSRLARTLRSP